jgi:hypothetical protein
MHPPAMFGKGGLCGLVVCATSFATDPASLSFPWLSCLSSSTTSETMLALLSGPIKPAAWLNQPALARLARCASSSSKRREFLQSFLCLLPTSRRQGQEENGDVCPYCRRSCYFRCAWHEGSVHLTATSLSAIASLQKQIGSGKPKPFPVECRQNHLSRCQSRRIYHLVRYRGCAGHLAADWMGPFRRPGRSRPSVLSYQLACYASCVQP